jgi:hypothetical protein
MFTGHFNLYMYLLFLHFVTNIILIPGKKKLEKADQKIVLTDLLLSIVMVTISNVNAVCSNLILFSTSTTGIPTHILKNVVNTIYLIN